MSHWQNRQTIRRFHLKNGGSCFPEPSLPTSPDESAHQSRAPLGNKAGVRTGGLQTGCVAAQRIGGGVGRACFVLAAALLLIPGTTLGQNAGPIVFVLEENRDLSETGLPSDSIMPFLSSIAASGALLTNFYANTHPSLPNYNWMLSGGNNGVTAVYCAPSDTVYNDNIFRQLIAQGVSFRMYIDGLYPLTGQDWVNCSDNLQEHNFTPSFARSFADLRNQDAATQNAEFVDFSQFAGDVAKGTLPAMTWIVPNLSNDGHDNPDLTAADNWLAANLPQLLATPDFQPGGHGILIVGWDEGNPADSACSATIGTGCGGNPAMVWYGPDVYSGYVSTTHYHHQATLRTIMELLGLTSFPQAAATAQDMGEVFGDPRKPRHRRRKIR
jgi:phosphatidylinositol-3-phosphatase